MSPNEMYAEYLDNAKNFMKVGTDAVTVGKAQACALIAQAIAATGFVTLDAFEDITLASTSNGKEALKRVPSKKETPIHVVEKPVEPPSVNVAPAPKAEPPKAAEIPKKPVVEAPKRTISTEELGSLTVEPIAAETPVQSEDPKPEIPEKDETEEAKAARYAWLIKNYGSVPVGQLDKSIWPYLAPEGRTAKGLDFYLNAHKIEVAPWQQYFASIASNRKYGSRSQYPVKEYLEAYIPFINDMNYFLKFTDIKEVNGVLSTVTNGQCTDFLHLTPDNISCWRIGVEAYYNGTLEGFEKDTGKAS